MPSIVVLDGHTLNPGDLNWAPLQELGPTTIFDYSAEGEIIERCFSADVIIANKAPITSEIIAALPNLKYIGVSATGYNNIDLEAARQRQIPVCNAVGYSTRSVAQHVFALLLALTNQPDQHHESVVRGDWAAQQHFMYTLGSIPELAGKTMGIYGLGRIGQQVAQIAQAFGMQVIATHKHPERDAIPGVQFVDLPTLFQQSDVISLHAPLTQENRGIVNRALLQTMQPTAYLINTGRGPLIVENDLQEALEKGWLAGAGLDVLSNEPPVPNHPLYAAPNLLITPHMAWATRASRQRLLDQTVANLQAFLEGTPRNNVAF